MPSVLGKSVLVIGGAGFIGSHLVERLLQGEPGSIAVIDDFSLGKATNLEPAERSFPQLRVYDADASDYDSLRRIVESAKVDVVFNLAVIPLPASLEQPKRAVETNIAVTLTACEISREGLIETLVHCSSSEVYGTARYVPMDESHPLVPLTPYAASKAASDHIVLSYIATFGLEAVIVRPFNNYGPRQNQNMCAGIIPKVIERILDGKVVEIQGDGEQTRDFIYVTETADGIVRAYEEPTTRGRVINVASGKEVPIKNLVRTIVDLSGSGQTEIRHVAPRPGDVRRHCGATRQAEKLFGFRSEIGLEEGLAQTVEWYVHEGRENKTKG